MKSDNQKHIDALNAELDLLLTDWTPDGSMPSNYVRKNGTGRLQAKVDRWCGHYQEPHYPVMIGWEVRLESGVSRGIVLVADHESVKGAMHQAQVEADAAIEKLMRERVDPNFFMDYETDESVCAECGRPIPEVTNASIKSALENLAGLDELKDALSRTEDAYSEIEEALAEGTGPEAVDNSSIDEQLARVIGAAKDVREALGLDSEGL